MMANTRPLDSAADSDVASHGVPESKDGGTVQADRESLQEHAGEVVLLHPPEVSIDRLGVVGRVELCPRARSPA